MIGSSKSKNPLVGDTREFEYIESEIVGDGDDKVDEDAIFRFQSTIKEEITIDLKDNDEAEKYQKYQEAYKHE